MEEKNLNDNDTKLKYDNEDSVSKKTEEKRQRKKFKFSSLIVLVALVVLGIGVSSFVSYCSNRGKRPEVITTKSTLDKVLEISDLSTIEYTYNGISTKYEDNDKDDVEYYVACEGNVEVGIDFNELKISVDDEKKSVQIELPKIKIQSVNVDIGKLQYILLKKVKESDSISQEAYKLCKKDIMEKASKDEDLLQNAYDNSKSVIEALVKPWLESLDEEYALEIK